MRKLTSLLLALVLLMTTVGAFAAEYTLDEKLFKQVKDGSGFKLVIKTDKTGGAFSVLDEATNAMLNSLLPGAEIGLNYLSGVGTLKGKEDLQLTLQKNGQSLGEARLLKDAQYEQLTSTFFGANRYVDLRDGGVLMALLTGNQQAWPPIEGVLLKLNTAESTWQGEVKSKLDEYSLKLSVWLQGYTKTETVSTVSGALQTKVSLSVPAPQLKAQIKQLMIDAYNDTALLALLAREMDARQAAAYLQPAMATSFSQALDLLPLNGNVESERVLDTQGNILTNKLSLPMGGVRGIDRIDYTFTADAAGGVTDIVITKMPLTPQKTKGNVITLKYEGGETAATKEVSYMGTISVLPENAGDAFTVGEQQGVVTAKEYAFSLLFTPGAEVVDQAAQTSIRDFDVSLRLTPAEDEAATQLVSLKLSLNSRLNSRSATYFTGNLTWTDEKTQAQVKGDISGNTAPPWSIEDINLTGATRVDTLTAAQKETLSTQMKTLLQNAMTAMMTRLVFSTAAP